MKILILKSTSVPCVVGMTSRVSDKGAMAFSASFYEALAFGQSMKQAFRLSCPQITAQRMSKERKPKLRTREGVDANKLFVRPSILAEFLLDGKGKPKTNNNSGYKLRVLIRDVPSEATSCSYQLKSA